MKIMIIQILGILDVIVAISFWIYGVFGLIPSGLVLILGLILLGKSIGFIYNLNIASILDIVCAMIIIFSSTIDIPIILVIIVSLFLLQKGIFSLLS
jgi:hypothetical protein